jgi:hypothetical protein
MVFIAMFEIVLIGMFLWYNMFHSMHLHVKVFIFKSQSKKWGVEIDKHFE